MPHNAGWCVIEESRQDVVQHFDDREKAVIYARECAMSCEGEVLVHETPCQPFELSTVPMPQRQASPCQAADWIAHGVKDSLSEV